MSKRRYRDDRYAFDVEYFPTASGWTVHVDGFTRLGTEKEARELSEKIGALMKGEKGGEQ